MSNWPSFAQPGAEVTNRKLQHLFLMTGAISPNRPVVNRTIVWAPVGASISPAKNVYLHLPTEENFLAGRANTSDRRTGASTKYSPILDSSRTGLIGDTKGVVEKLSCQATSDANPKSEYRNPKQTLGRKTEIQNPKRIV
jgi:hypothetical protein